MLVTKERDRWKISVTSSDKGQKMLILPGFARLCQILLLHFPDVIFKSGAQVDFRVNYFIPTENFGPARVADDAD